MMKPVVILISTLYTYHIAASPIAGIRQIASRDIVNPLPEIATKDDKRWQPAADFDTDSCYNTAAISPDGQINPGMDHNYSGPSENCRNSARLDNNNVYSRKRCNNGWCAFIYDYYFEKDVAVPYVIDAGGHRNDWEHVIVFVKDGKAEYVAVGKHGDFDTRKAEDVRWEDGTHPKVVYHKQGGSTHMWRFAREDDDKIENERGVWFKGPLVSYNGFPSTELREKLTSHDFDKARSIAKPRMAISDRYIRDNLNWAKNDVVPGFDSGVDDAQSPGIP
ncbi:necrosis inducing protein-domain-containing protein [Daldinia grandis]|nr:necrosis inducing protein-domain-containing protein [Daldinia grandis]